MRITVKYKLLINKKRLETWVVGKAVWFLVVIIIIGVFVVCKFPELLDPSSYDKILDSQDEETFVKLDVRMKESGYWSIQSGLSSYRSDVTYFVYNLGDANASDVHVTLSVDDAISEDFVLPLLVSDDYYQDEFSISVHHDESKQITLTASCENNTDTATIRIRVTLDRASFNSQSGKLYITPNDPLVLQTLTNITMNPLIPDWIEIRDWVANNIEYTADSEAHAVKEYWQFPNETLTLRTGDCEDFSILLCSLLRANGWNENEVYVVIGAKDELYHGWVKLNIDAIGWQSLEPGAGALNTLVGDFLSLSGFKAMYIFNDIYFETL